MNLKRTAGRFKKRLFRINDDEPLSKLSLVVILLLDFFILSILFNGLDDHSRQLTRTYDYVPSTCRDVLIDKTYTLETRLDLLQGMVLQDHGNYSYRYKSRYDSDRMDQMHQQCQALYSNIHTVSDQKSVRDLFLERKKSQRDSDKHKRDLEKYKSAYDTALLEKIAKEKDSRLPAIKKSIHDHTKAIETLQQKILVLNRALDDDIHIKKLVQTYFLDTHPFKKELLKSLQNYEFWYPLKRFSWEILYLLPIFGLFLLWSHHSVTKNYTLQILVTSHLLVVTAFPILLKILDLILELIPKHFFQNLFELLERLNLIALWHYGVILFIVSFALFVIYIIQKKLFNQTRLYEHRLMKGACFYCGKKLPLNAKACPFCATKQYEVCKSCGQERLIGATYCSQCGDGAKPDE